MPFQFTHPGRGATPAHPSLYQFNEVSIHAPREGCDDLLFFCLRDLRRFNSRTPGGVRLVPDSDYSGVGMFQFTHPGRGATGETSKAEGLIPVSIHAPREGCDAYGAS